MRSSVGYLGFGGFFQLGVACVVVLWIVHYYVNSTDRHIRASPGPIAMRTAVHHRRQHIWYMRTLENYSVGLVWPHDDDIDDRILSQIDVMNVYAQQKRKRKLKVILRVGKFNVDKINWFAGQESFVRDKCPIVDCWNTDDQSQARKADALLISEFRSSSRRRYLPKPRGQIWIAQHREPPIHNRIDPRSVRGLINWTATYRRDSTIPMPVRKMAPNVSLTATTTSSESLNYAAGKTKLVAWFVSNCNAGNQRMRYAQELSKFIQV